MLVLVLAALAYPWLPWTSTVEQATATLTVAGMHPAQGERHVWHGEGHTVEPEMSFTPRPGWSGEARWAAIGGPLVEVRLTRITPRARDIAGEQAELTRRFGKPTKVMVSKDYGESQWWKRDGFTAGLLVPADRSQVEIVYRRD
jgi:hypothetical protein